MSVTSPDAVFQTPDSIVIVQNKEPTHSELEPEREEPDPALDLGASPNLDGPVTRSGKKRKNLAPVKSASKKKNKMASSTPTSAMVDAPEASDASDVPVVPPSTPTTQPDLATLLANGLAGIQTSMGGMEARITEKISSLEGAVKNNERQIKILTSSVRSNTDDLSTLRRRLDATESGIDQKIDEMIRSAMSSSHALSVSTDLSQETHRSLRSLDQTEPVLEVPQILEALAH